MSYANGTTHYNLPQTVGTDKRDWSDTNQAFSAVDAALHTAAETASTAASDISTLDNQINGVGGIDSRLTTAENDIDNVEGAVSTLQTTVAGHTSAIADVRQDAEDMITAHNEAAAESTSHYDIGEEFIYNDVLYRATAEINIGDTIVPNTNCSATNVMTEVNEINTALSALEDRGSVSVTCDGVKTISAMFDELNALIDYSKVEIATSFVSFSGNQLKVVNLDRGSRSVAMGRTYYSVTSGVTTTTIVRIKSSGSGYDASHIDTNGYTTEDMASTVPSNGQKITFHY